jgi:hypothetical protein
MPWIKRSVLCFALLRSLPTMSLPTDAPATTLTILLFNNSHASPQSLIRTKEGVDDIFRKSGIGLVWIDCPPGPGSLSARLCEDESAPGEIRVRIVDRQFKNYLPENTFGFAIPPIWATVYYESALHLAKSITNYETDVSLILSCLIGHEIGHLLLGQNAHAVDGIMTPRWEIGQIQQAMRRDLRFTPEQSKMMLRNAQRRISGISASLSVQTSARPKGCSSCR